MASVKGAMVGVTDPTGRVHQLYKGAVVPDYVSADEIKRLVDLDLVDAGDTGAEHGHAHGEKREGAEDGDGTADTADTAGAAVSNASTAAGTAAADTAKNAEQPTGKAARGR